MANDGDDYLTRFYLAGRARTMLTDEEETRLGELSRVGREASEELRQAGEGRPGLLFARQVAKLQQRATEGEIARDELVRAHRWIVVNAAERRLAQATASFPARIAAGHDGLRWAALRFDPRTGFKFATYATWWVRRAISHRETDAARAN